MDLRFGVSALRHRRGHGRLRCADDYGTPGSVHVGVALDYDGDWWDERGQRLYWGARRSGETTAPGITRKIIAEEVGADSTCMSQFPPHSNTIEANSGLWNHLISRVQQEMANERAA